MSALGVKGGNNETRGLADETSDGNEQKKSDLDEGEEVRESNRPFG